jgi:quercetin dioxygenase-like cupin family protein
MHGRHSRIIPAIILLALAFAIGSTGGRDKPDLQKPLIQRPDELNWRDGPASLPAGAKIAVLDGDPTKSGPFVMRIKLPDGYKIPPHTHPKPERVTVIAGSFHLGMGDRFDVKHAQELAAGTYGTWPVGMKHFVWVEGETIVQFHGDGPWTIEYLDPADDPRLRK